MAAAIRAFIRPAAVASLCGVAGMLGGAAIPQQLSRPDDIIVEGSRDPLRVQGGLWQLDLSRSYYYGRANPDFSKTRPAGSDRTWRFCLPDAGVESLIRLLVGQGRTESSGTMNCRPLTIRLGDGRLKADQTCFGSTITGSSSPSGQVSATSARDALTVTGRYSTTALTMDFDSRREPVTPDASYSSRGPDGRHWSIRGNRVGDCPKQPAATHGK